MPGEIKHGIECTEFETLLSEVLEAVVINKSSRGPHFTPADIRPRWRAELSD